MLRIRLLGQFEITADGKPVELTSRFAQSLLAYLLLTPGVAHRREKLAGMLWPDTEETSARRSLRQILWQIRRALGAHGNTLLDVDDLTIAFAAHADVWIDAAQVTQSINADTTIDQLLATVQASGGELLPGFYDEWVMLERERIQAQAERKFQMLLDRLVEHGRWEEVLHWAEHWIALGTSPEPAYRALMFAHAALGDSAHVAEVYRRCLDALQRDLGVEPSSQTRLLFEKLRAGEGVVAYAPLVATPYPSPLTPLHNLPNQLTSFIGRQKELAEIHRLLSPSATHQTANHIHDGGGESVRLLTLTGPGGTGKTRLAIQAAFGLIDHFADGVWLVELATINDPNLIAQMVAAALDVHQEPNFPLIQSVLDFLRNRNLLLIFDNCEHLVEPVAQFTATVLRACPQLKILSSSRETLGMPGEVVLRVPSLSLPDAQEMISLPDLVQYEAIRLFVERADAVAAHFVLNAANAAIVVQICRQLDGIPLAIELAAARVRAMSVEQIADRLDDRFRLLTGGNRAALPRQQTLRATMDWSWELLSETERMLLQRLAVFINGWTLEAAEEICTCAAIAVGDVLDLLTHLVEKSLVQMQQVQLPERGENVRYYLLETIRQYANDKLVLAGEAEAIRSRHLAFFWQLSIDAEPKLRSDEQLTWLAWLELEHDNLRAAFNWAISGNALEPGLALAANLMRYWYLCGFWNEGRDWLTLLLRIVPPATLSESPGYLAARAKALYCLGWLCNEDGEHVAYYNEGLAICRKIGDRWGEAYALRGLSSTATHDVAGNRSEEAITRLRQSLAIFESLGDPWGMALARFSWGWQAVMAFHTDEAEAQWHESLDLFQQTGDRWGCAVTHIALGFASRRNGAYDRAESLMRAGLALFRELGDKAGVANSLLRLASLAFRRGDYADALALLQKGLSIEQERDALEGVVNAMQVQGIIACYQGGLARGITILEESVALAYQRESGEAIADSLNHLGFAYYQQNNLPQANEVLEESLELYRQENDTVGIAIAQYDLALVALVTGDLERAERYLHDSFALFLRWGDVRFIADGLDGQARLAQLRGDSATALLHAKECLQLRQRMGDKLGIAEALERIAANLHDPDRSLRLMASAATLRQKIGAPVLPVERAIVDRHLEGLRQQLGHEQFAIAWAEGAGWQIDEVIQSAFAS